MLKQWKGMKTLRLSNRSIFTAQTSLSKARCEHIPNREFYKTDIKALENTLRQGAWSLVKGFYKTGTKMAWGRPHWSGPVEPLGQLDIDI